VLLHATGVQKDFSGDSAKWNGKSDAKRESAGQG
jgi:hypothetical protein